MAIPILLYLLKANAALLLFAAAYFGLLRQLTFFSLNRFYLLFALVFAAVYPALPVPALLPPLAETPVAMVLLASTSSSAGPLAGPVGPAIDWAMAGLAVYAAGAAVLLAKLLVQLLSLWRLRRTSRPAVLLGLAVRVLPGAVSPFSFGQTIYLSPTQHPAAELTAVLRHEQVHVHQWHTLDVLLAHVALAAAWCNPAAWLLRRALLDNLEFLADHAALQTGLDRQAYQYSLLRLSQAQPGPSLVSHFTFPTLKNRVTMMNTPFSSTGQLARYFVAGPLVLALALGFSGARAQGAGPVVPAPAAAVRPAPAPVRQAGVTAAAQAPLAKAVEAAPGKKGAAPTRSLTSVVARSVAPIAKLTGPQPIYYLDGKLTKDAINTVNPKDLVSVNVIKGEAARLLAGEAGAAGVVVLTTRQNQDAPEVRAFNEKLGVAAVPAPVAPEQPKTVAYLAPAALAYITKTYPGARLLGVSEVRAADGTSRYQAEIVLGRRPGYLLFDAQGQLISDSYTSHTR